MCGLVAIRSLHRPVDPARVRAALASVRHRGPDGSGAWLSPDRRTALGHVRLAIIDLETGAQPIASELGDLQLIVNGELYDSDQLRESLAARGHRLRTRTDSEVALHLYQELGAEAVRLLRGEFALVLWDERAQRLFAARDRFGVKPLFYALHAGELLIASEAKALFAAGLPAAWDDEGSFQALHMCLAHDRTLYRDVRQVPPGHTLTFEAGKLTVAPYWDTDYPSRFRRGRVPSEAEAVHTTGQLLESAVRTRLRADVPLACYLSGGVDSSSVLGLAQRLHSGPIAAFTVAFDHDDFDESAVAERMARRAGAAFHVVRVAQRDYVDLFVEGVGLAEIPPYNGHAPARFLLSRAVHQAGYKVALGGEGADELFAGYEFVQAALRGSGGGGASMLALAWRLLRPRSSLTRQVSEISPLLALLVQGIGFPDALLAYLSEKTAALRGMLAPEFVARHRDRDPYREFLARFDWRRLAGAEPFQVLLHLWMRSHFVNYVLAAERLDMAHAVELRLPFLDHHLFEYTRTLPASLLYSGQRNKHLLRSTVAPYVTNAVRLGPKKPFFAPPTSASRASPLYTLAQDLIRSAAFGKIPFFHQPSVIRVLDALDEAPDEERGRLDPLYFFLAGLAVLSERYKLST
jgi:asparagine synthase (glutamine-hydrolysing)